MRIRSRLDGAGRTACGNVAVLTSRRETGSSPAKSPSLLRKDDLAWLLDREATADDSDASRLRTSAPSSIRWTPKRDVPLAMELWRWP
jgi:hypothetical protein